MAANIKQELGPKLSSKSALLLPSDADFETTGKRWNLRFPINYSAIVDASCEEDVAATVKYANAAGIPYLAFNGTHGAQKALLKFKDGIGITTGKMNSFTISEDDGGQTAVFKGSWLSGHARDELYKLGKRSTFGSCDSTGVIGPMLGGGHGLLQGRYGLLADQIVSMRVVLASGDIITVTEDSHPDLYWAMRGAGHNFGIVTEFKYKIYDAPKEDLWTVSTMVFAREKLEKLVEVFNEVLRKQPVELALWFPQFRRLPDLNAKDPVIEIVSLYEGHESDNPLLKPLHALGPLTKESKVTPWPHASEAIGWGWSNFSNQKGLCSIMRFPVGAKRFSYPAMKETYDRFATVTAEEPSYGYSLILWEAYSTQAVKAVPDEATAVADRADDMLSAVFMVYPHNPELDAPTEAIGKEFRQMLVSGHTDGELHAYINYSNGDESLEEVYGHQAWRLEKLRRLKKQYDPENKFGFYSPIV